MKEKDPNLAEDVGAVNRAISKFIQEHPIIFGILCVSGNTIPYLFEILRHGR